MPQQQKITVEISAKTVLFAAGLLVVMRGVWELRDLFFSLFIAFIIMSAAKQPVNALEKRGVSRILGTAIVFALSLIVFGLFLSWIIPPLVLETGLFIKNFPEIIRGASTSVPFLFNQESIGRAVPSIGNQMVGFVTGLFSNVVFITSTLFFSIYFTADNKSLEATLVHFLGQERSNRAVSIVARLERRMGMWLMGEFALMTVVGLVTYIGLTLLGVKYALPLALIAGLLEAVPNLGPTIAAIPAFFVGLSQSVVLGILTILLSIVVQQAENNVLVPFIMKKMVGVNPILSLIALIVGGRFGGVLGVLLAIPITIVVEVLLLEVLTTRKTVNIR